MTRQPLELPQADDMVKLVAALGGDAEMASLIKMCPECSQAILVCDNGWLDAKITDADEPLAMGVLKMGPLHMMAGGAIEGGSKHKIHDHQPSEDEDLV